MNGATNLKINTVPVQLTGRQCRDLRIAVMCDERIILYTCDNASSGILNFLQMVGGVIKETIK